jgi:spore coat assembly protein
MADHEIGKKIEIGDFVSRKSYGGDILFRVEKLIMDAEDIVAVLRGLYVRLCADAPVADLEKRDGSEVARQRSEFESQFDAQLRKTLARRSAARSGDQPHRLKEGEDGDFFEFPGRVLHLDGDAEYSALCQQSYNKLKVKAWTLNVPEEKQAEAVQGYLREYRPDILVLTGHDGLLKVKKDWRKIDNYRHSKYFVAAVEKARELEPDRDQLVIFAGGCQSYFEALIEAGANFASAPKRVLIHVYDPVLVAEKIAYTPIGRTISVREIIDATVTGVTGVGGLESKGHFRKGFPGPLTRHSSS